MFMASPLSLPLSLPPPSLPPSPSSLPHPPPPSPSFPLPSSSPPPSLSPSLQVARSVLTSHELQTFNYYVGQYEHRGLPVDDLVTPLLELLNTAEKVSSK